MSFNTYTHLDVAVYEALTAARQDDVSVYTAAGRSCHLPILECGCGTGRVLVPLLACGVPVIGIDNSPTMLGAAKRKVARLPEAQRMLAKLVVADMRQFAVSTPCSLAVIPYWGFNQLLNYKDQTRALRTVRRCLETGAVLIASLLRLRDDVQRSWGGGRDLIRRTNSRLAVESLGGEVNVECETVYRASAQVVEKRYSFVPVRSNHTVSRFESVRTLRHVGPEQMRGLLLANGFRVRSLEARPCDRADEVEDEYFVIAERN